MTITLNAFRINKLETTVFLSFSNILDDHFNLIETTIIKSSKDEYGVIFHIKNPNQSPIQGGNDTISFKDDFLISSDRIRVFYWNDEQLLSNNLEWFQDFLERHGLDENIPIGDFSCVKSSTKSIHIPRQSGNGGVLGITNLP